MTRWIVGLVLGLALLASPAHAQDEFDVSSARVYASPGDMMRWPITATITSVTFTDVGFPTRFDRMDGPNRWPDVTPPGWDGPIQYTLGLCLWAPDGQWECSAVVQFWHGRQDADPNSTTAPYAIDSNWFYASHMSGGGGSLTDRNPRPNERVGIFVVRGNGRYGTDYTTVHERSNVVMVNWDHNYQVALAPPPPPVVVPPPAPPQPVPQSPPAPLPPAGPQWPTLDLSSVPVQLENIYGDLTRQIKDLKLDLTALQQQLKAHDENPTWLSRVLGNHYVQLALSGFGTYYTTKLLTKPAAQAATPAPAAAAPAAAAFTIGLP